MGCPHPNSSSLGSLLSARVVSVWGEHTGAPHLLLVPLQPLGRWSRSLARTGGSLQRGARGHRCPRCSTAGPRGVPGISSPSPGHRAPCPLPAGPSSAKSSRSRSSTLVREHASCAPTPAPGLPSAHSAHSVPRRVGPPRAGALLPVCGPRAPPGPAQRGPGHRCLPAQPRYWGVGSTSGTPQCPQVSIAIPLGSPCSTPRLLLHPRSRWGIPGSPVLAGRPLGGSPGHNAAL